MSGHSAASGYPVAVRGALDPALSRWRWLLKWLLALPHVVVLTLLWAVAWALTLVAGLAILVSGRYPRGIFEFNVGVMRWTWRVAFYAYSSLATDHYPPFRLGPDPDYPADLEVAYPAHLSRGLVLVKWWLLAIPHYLVVGVFTGGLVLGLEGFGHVLSGTGLIALLVLIAAVALTFSGTYPRPLFDLVMGLNRWCYRVLAYSALMTDRYPPFRLDCGGEEPVGSSRAAAT